jgi:UDP-GlcNAc:undecaprenyl-phosphate/decaprenyl-phosphate GlcNAc-1-phosphate transferase
LPDDVRLVGAALTSLFAVWLLTPLAIRVAARTGFYDHPVKYKAHAVPTAYLGGAAVIAGFVIAASAFGNGLGHFAPILACAVGLAVLGTIDDRIAVRPLYRVLAEVAAAVVLWAYGLGWSFLSSDFEQLVLTSLWIVGFTNAFNLMDNMDGAASTVSAVCAAGIAGAALIVDELHLAALALALSGACLAFLRYNLRAGAPARIFLGDGGSMPIGFTVAALAMSLPASVDGGLGWPILLVGGLLLAIPVLDTLLVIVSRTRRRVPLATGGLDHLTHRLKVRLGSARAVALALAVTQAGVSCLAIVAYQVGRTTILAVTLAALAAGAAIVAVLETPAWMTAGGEPPRHPRSLNGSGGRTTPRREPVAERLDA